MNNSQKHLWQTKYLFILIFFFWGVSAHQSSEVSFSGAFISTVSGNWNDGASWGNASPGVAGIDFPSANTIDIVTIAAGHTIIIPPGFDAFAASLTLSTASASTWSELQIKGNLSLAGDLTLMNYTGLNMFAGITLDLGSGNLVMRERNHKIHSTGTASNRVTVVTAGGEIQVIDYEEIDLNLQYTDFSNLGAAKFGGEIANAGYNIVNSTFAFTGNISFPVVRNIHNAVVENSDFRNTGTTEIKIDFLGTGGQDQTGVRSINHSTFAGNSVGGNIIINIRFKENTSISNNIYKNTLVHHHRSSDVFNCVNADFSKAPASATIHNGVTVDNCYFYTDYDNPHTIISYSQVDNNLVFSNNIIEAVYNVHTDGGDHLIVGNGNYDIYNNIILDNRNGTFLNALGVNKAHGTYRLFNNTRYSNGLASGYPEYGMLARNETGGRFYNVCEIWNNITYENGTQTNTRGINIGGTETDQIDFVDYNSWYNIEEKFYGIAFSGATPNPGYGQNDLDNIDPEFFDQDRNLGNWYSSIMGGNSDALGAIDELLKINQDDHNPAFTQNNLFAYIRAGFRPTNPLFATAGNPDGFPYIGAVSNTADLIFKNSFE